MNFGSNAIKYNRPGGKVSFSVSVPEPGRVRVGVADDGIGIPADKQAKLFQPFQRAGQETGPIEGTGIGLVITKRLVQLMEGSIGFRSVAGEGSEFWVDMPAIEAASDGVVSEPVPAEPAPRRADRTQRLVLYVEDNPANVAFMRDMMSTFEDVDLVTLPTAELGVEFARARHPEFVIMDINLPGMSGLDALRALRAAPETKSIPVVALTAAASEREQRRGRHAGFHRYLTKPLNVAEFIEVMESLLGASA
ncbi:MAG TPA: ATP-binding protein [Polyangiaceae bacterium]|nr:ATP-binding protein [Polyangiaceae bacterium]